MHKQMRILTCIACLLSAGALKAACPVASDLKAGIKVEFLDSSYFVFDIHDGTTRERRYDHLGALDKIFTLHEGIVSTKYVGVTNGIGGLQSTMSYTFELSDVTPIETGKYLGGHISIKSNFGDAQYPYSMSIGEGADFELGTCVMKNFPTTEFMKFPEGIASIEYAYLSELGFRILLKDSGSSYDPIVYTPLKISVVSDKD